MKLRHKRTLVVTAILLILIAVAGYVFVKHKDQNNSHYTYLEGVVTAYDVTPTYSDGGIIFSIDNTSVDIGGGLRANGDQPEGYVYSPIKVGDKVKAKVVQPEPGFYSVYSCSECYVKKQ